MSLKNLGRAAAIAGAIGLILSLAANPLGLGSNPLEFGWLQVLGSILGCLLIIVGLWLSMREK